MPTTLNASSKDATSPKATASRTSIPKPLCSMSWAVLRPLWKLPKPSTPTGYCLATSSNKPMRNRPTHRLCSATRSLAARARLLVRSPSTPGCDSLPSAAPPPWPRCGIPWCRSFERSTVTPTQGVLGTSLRQAPPFRRVRARKRKLAIHLLPPTLEAVPHGLRGRLQDDGVPMRR